MRDDRAVRIVTNGEGSPQAARELPSMRPASTGRVASGSATVAPAASDTPANRNGVPILPLARDGRRVTPEAVDRLRDEI